MTPIAYAIAAILCTMAVCWTLLEALRRVLAATRRDADVEALSSRVDALVKAMDGWATEQDRVNASRVSAHDETTARITRLERKVEEKLTAASMASLGRG